VAAVASRRRKSVDGDKKRAQWENDAEIHVLHRFATWRIQKRKRNPTVGSMLLRWRKP
jgi:hypothetical protein